MPDESRREVGITAYGAYVPRRRLQRSAVHQAHAWFAPGLKGLAKGERAMANWDEDVVTMATEAARDCLGGEERGSIASLLLASTSAPFADRQNAGIVKEALNLSDAVTTLDAGGSRKAGTSALIQALRAVEGGAGETLCIAAERHRSRPASEAELLDGDGAAALLLGSDRVIARFLGAHSVSIDFVDHFRAAGAEFDYVWEARWVRDEGYLALAGKAIAAALAAFGLAGSDVDHLVAPIAARGVPEALAKATGIAAGTVADGLSARLGDCGTAHPLVMLAHVLETARPGEKILLLGFGQGADILLFEATAEIERLRRPLGVSGWLARGRSEDNYMRYLAFAGHLKLDVGMRAEFDQKQPLTALYRNRKTVLALVGGRCPRTGAIQFPKSEIGVPVDGVATTPHEDYPLADRPARILTFTADRLGYSPDPPGCYGMVEFDGGGRMVCEFTDVEPEALEVGMPMRMVFRIKAVDERRDFIRYFWKAAPAAGEA
ncbi:hydroxymethylglutaryl-CoA synthase family protein [Sphingosinicella terrae]|uniref:hydroxymethylglutaryl-CoA synthase family protein n=1 Tax=Sphingosinicella terrae TaxID=2172047 RepID=UPI000E0CC7B9|nr:OB-fold domain-containing protein [Sphingosinicella terrae]